LCGPARELVRKLAPTGPLDPRSAANLSASPATVCVVNTIENGSLLIGCGVVKQFIDEAAIAF